MQFNIKNTEPPREIIANLIALSRTDTLFRDLYFQRARYFLQGEMTLDDYHAYSRLQTNLLNLPNQIRNAMDDGNWSLVGELSKEHKSLSEELERTKSLQVLAKAIYDSQEIPIDPFSPGMNTIPGGYKHNLNELDNDIIRKLKALCQGDPEWKKFYAQRLKSFEKLSTEIEASDTLSPPAVSLLKDEAIDALENGNFDKLEELAENLSDIPPTSTGSAAVWSTPEDNYSSSDGYAFEFEPETIRKAQALGLNLHHLPSDHQKFSPFCRFAWHPTYAQVEKKHDGLLYVPDLPMPEGTPDALRARVQLFATHPLINSAGVRYLPTMLNEDVLVEDFTEPVSGSDLPTSPLLEALGLTRRNRLNRLHIEAVLLDKGNDLLRNDLGLDPFEFKLVCIPPDLHLRIGLERGWGQQKIWTHFDGYMVMADGKLWALAGGDIRFGGIYDLLGIGRNYDSDRIIVRFAIVLRRRLAIQQ